MSIQVKPGYHHGDLRRALLLQASVLLEEVGSDALSIRKLARLAGVSPRAPYRHFADKEELLSAVAADGFRTFGEVLAAAQEAAVPGRAIEEQVVAYVRFALAAPGCFRLMFGPRRAEPEGRLADAKAAAFNILQASVERISSPADDTRALAVGYWSFAHGLAVLFLDGRVQEDLDGEDEAVVRRVAAALLGFVRRPAPEN